MFYTNRIHVHEKYSDITMDHDIALLHVTKDMYNSDIDLKTKAPICLDNNANQLNLEKRSQEGKRTKNDTKMVQVSGWGYTLDPEEHYFAAPSNSLRYTSIPLVTKETCNKKYYNRYSNIEISDKQICGGYEDGRSDSCQGDSGGPLVYKDGNGVWSQVGVVSWGVGCAKSRHPGVYTRVSSYKDWIESHIDN